MNLRGVHPIQPSAVLVIIGNALLANAAQTPSTKEFTSAPFTTSQPAWVAWQNEERVIFSVGMRYVVGNTSCSEKPSGHCNDQTSIQVWDVVSKKVSPYLEGALLICYSQGRISYSKGDIIYTGEFLGQPKPTSFRTSGSSLNWQDCLPSTPTASTPLDERKEYYPFMQAHLIGNHYRDGNSIKLRWEGKDGRRWETVAPDGPWKRAYHGRGWFYPTARGLLFTGGRRGSFLVSSDKSVEFFPGSIVSTIGVSPTGCRVSFFGAAPVPGSKRWEVKLYARDLC